MAFPFAAAARKRAPSPPRIAGPVWALAASWRAVRHSRAWLQRRRGKGGAPPAFAAVLGLTSIAALLLILRVATDPLVHPDLGLRNSTASAVTTRSAAGASHNLSRSAAMLVSDFAVPPAVAAAAREPEALRLLTKLALLREAGVATPRLLVIHAQNGLGNRLRALSSALAIARRTRRVPLVVWQADAHLGARFGDILEARAPPGRNDLVTALYADLVVLDEFPKWSAVSARGQSWRPFNYMVKDGPSARQGETLYFASPPVLCTRGLLRQRCEPRADVIRASEHVYFKSAYVASAFPRNLSPPTAVNAEIRLLRPNEEVRAIVKQYYPSHVRYVFGAHVRSRLIKVDGLEVDGRCEYTADAEEMTDFWRSRSQLSEFVNLLHYLLNKYRSLHFFVAADDAALLKRASKAFPGRVHYIPRACDDRSPECVKYAMADLLALARTMRIYGSNWSSFTEVAGRLGNRRPLLSGVHFGKGKGKDQNYRDGFQRALRTWKVRLGRALVGWKTRCPKRR